MADENSTTSAHDMFELLTRFEEAKCSLRNGLDLFDYVFAGFENGKRREAAFGFILTAMELHQAQLEGVFKELWAACRSSEAVAS